jgi:hypothetical protein
VWGIGGKARTGVELKPEHGPFMHLHLLTQPGKTVHGAVVQPGSEAKKQGWDITFAACSQECADTLKDALQKESYIGEVFGL